VRGTGGHVIPSSKPRYREVATDRVTFSDPNEVHQAKVDGANVTFHLRADKGIKVFSHRPTERATGVIEHTHKLPRFRELKAPPSLAGTVLRGELYGERRGRAIPAEQLGGLLNAGVWKSREKQRAGRAELKPVIFDVVRHKGRDMENAPYAEKLKVLEEVQRKVPRLKLPPMARTPKEKAKLFSKIQSGKEPISSEGIVAWKLDNPRPTKAKFRPDVDAEVVGITQGKGKHEGRIGALKVRLPGQQAVTNVGTGLSDQLRQQIAKDPEAFIGRVAKIRTQQVFPSGRLRAPSFGEFHIEKGKQPNGQ
jgi:ATP-dependent DNA ligase